MNLAFPFGFDRSGRTASATNQDQHIRDLIEQVLLTAPGERVNRPTFGTGTAQLVFAPVIRPTFTLVSEFTAATERGLGGFGSTGI